MITSYKVLAIIPARGGSKRIPNKNIKLLNKKPLIAYSIEEAKKSKYIDRIIVSTDSFKIAKIAKKYGAEVPFLRPKNIAKDDTTDFDVFKHALYWLEKKEKYTPDIIVQLRPTSPLRTYKTINKAIKTIVENPDVDSVRTVTEPEQSPYKMYKIDKRGLLQPLLSIKKTTDFFNLPHQKLPKSYKHVGYVDVMWRKTITHKKSMTGKKIMPLILDNAYSGINTKKDWDYYEFLIKNNK